MWTSPSVRWGLPVLLAVGSAALGGWAPVPPPGQNLT